jgi:bile acid-coenzyme A ligase
VVGVDPSEVPGRPAVAVGFEPEVTLADDPLPPVVPASWKAPTSGGSTGRPKLIVATQPGVLKTIAGLYSLTPRVPEGVALVTGPLAHNGPFVHGCAGLLMGVHQVVMTRFDATNALELIERYQVDWMWAVPTMMLRIWRLPESERRARDLSSMRTVLHVAAPCPPWLKQAWIDWLRADRIWELYGGTEAQAITVINGHEWLRHRGSVGRPVIGEIRVLDAGAHACPPGVVGEVWMRRGEGAPPSYRYIGAEAKVREGWESLGDMGWMDADGYLYLTDRDTDMILVGGANVYPAEVEAALEEHPMVRGSCVIGLPDEDLGNRVHAIIQAEGEVSDAELLAHLRERLAPYKLPRSFERVTERCGTRRGRFAVRRSGPRAWARRRPVRSFDHVCPRIREMATTVWVVREPNAEAARATTSRTDRGGQHTRRHVGRADPGRVQVRRTLRASGGPRSLSAGPHGRGPSSRPPSAGEGDRVTDGQRPSRAARVILQLVGLTARPRPGRVS